MADEQSAQGGQQGGEDTTQNQAQDPIEESARDHKGGSKAVVVVIVLVIIAAGVIYARGGSNEDSDTTIQEASEVIENEDENTEIFGEGAAEDVMEKEEGTVIEGGFEVDAPVAQTREFNVTGKNFEFSLGEIKVKKGDTVRINFSSTDGFHDWTIDEFAASTEQVNTGGASTVVFTADRAGTFEYYCSVGSHRQLGMVGNLIVE
jgi:plastocyanin